MIGTYCVKISEISQVADARAGINLTKCSLEIVTDVVNEKLLVMRTLEPLGNGIRFPSKQVFLFIGTGTYLLNEEGVFAEYQQPRRTLPFPDPLSLGAGFLPETTSYYPFHEVTTAMHSNENSPVGWVIKTTGSITSFHYPPPSGNPNDPNSQFIAFDTARDFLPVEQQLRGGPSGNEILVQSKIKPVLVKKIWLPGTVSYVSNERDFLHMELDWVSVNEPLPAGLFERETLERLFSAKDVNDLLSK